MQLVLCIAKLLISYDFSDNSKTISYYLNFHNCTYKLLQITFNHIRIKGANAIPLMMALGFISTYEMLKFDEIYLIWWRTKDFTALIVEREKAGKRFLRPTEFFYKFTYKPTETPDHLFSKL